MRLPSRVVVLTDEAHVEALAKRVSIIDVVGVAEQVLPAVVWTDEPKALLGIPTEHDTTDAGLGGGGRRGVRRKRRSRRRLHMLERCGLARASGRQQRAEEESAERLPQSESRLKNTDSL